MKQAVARWSGSVAGAVVVAALITPSAASGAGETYEVVQCDPLNRGVPGAALEDAPSYAVKQGCGDPKEEHAIKISNTRFAQQGRSGRVRWSTQSPSLRIDGLSARAKLRRDRGHMPRLWMADGDGDELARVAVGTKNATGFRQYSWHSSGPRAEQFIAHLRCEHRGGCKHSDVAKTWLRNIHFQVADYADPRLLQVGGSLLRPGWIRGEQSVAIHAADSGSGIQRIALEANQQVFASSRGYCDRIQATTAAHVFAPCGLGLGLDAPSATSRAPFHDGRNGLSICALDFAGNRTCRGTVVYVDNTPPSLAFTRFQNPNDPELIRAPIVDKTSGVAAGRIYYRAVDDVAWRALPTEHRAGQLQARVNSTLDPPGRYEFMARGSDVAGNTTTTTLRSNGRPMVLSFPLKSGVQLQAHLHGGAHRLTVGYGRTSKVSGTLRDASGRPLANQGVTITEDFGDGALIGTRVRTVQTDSHGRWKERLPGGPSRRVSASYGGSRRYLPAGATAGALQVKTKASLRISNHRVREGHRVAFKGRIGHLAARIPPGGKLVELEVKDGKSWHTVRHPFYTRPNGRYRLRYRFARFYVSNVRYRFRGQSDPGAELALQGTGKLAGPKACRQGALSRPEGGRVKIRRHLTYANVTATLALLLAVGGGAAYAVDKINSRDVVNGSIRSVDLKNKKAVRGTDVERNSLTGKQIDERRLNSSSIAQVMGGETGGCTLLMTPRSCAAGTLTLPRTSRILVIATGNQESLGGPGQASCRISIDNRTQPFAVDPGEVATDNTAITATNGFARTFVSPDRFSAGKHVIALSCKRLIGNVRIDSPTIAAVAVGVG